MHVRAYQRAKRAAEDAPAASLVSARGGAENAFCDADMATCPKIPY
jgi:hypothetical protein